VFLHFTFHVFCSKLSQLLCIVVHNEADIAAFKNYTGDDAAATKAPEAPAAKPAPPAAAAAPSQPAAAPAASYPEHTVGEQCYVSTFIHYLYYYAF